MGVKFSSLSLLVCVGTVGGIISSEILDLNCLVEPSCGTNLPPGNSLPISQSPQRNDVEVSDVPELWDIPSEGWDSTQL